MADAAERYQIELGPPPDIELIPLRREIGIGSENRSTSRDLAALERA